MDRGFLTGLVNDVQASGRLVFSLDDIVAKGRDVTSLASTIRRHVASGAIVRLSQRSSTFLIVPPEYRWYGAPPVEWWLDDVMTRHGGTYYLGLLSAAGMHGSSHFAIMETQVVTTKILRPINVGKIVVKFFQRADAQSVPVEIRQNQWSPLNISTPEATAIDILQFRPCGIARAAMAIFELMFAFKKNSLKKALDLAETATAQRFGFVLQYAGNEQMASVVETWLSHRRPQPVVLEAGGGVPWAIDRRWQIKVNAKLEAAT